MKIRSIIIIIIIASAMFIYRQLPTLKKYEATEAPIQVMAQAADTQAPTATPTSTPVPPPTIDYQQTAAVAQSTALEAVRVNAQVTAAYEIRVQEQLQITAQADREWFAIQFWTQQAASTVIPLTATQQAVLNTQIPMQQMVALAQITATYAAPTQMVAMARAEQAVRYSGAEKVASILGLVSVSLFCLVLVVFLIVKMRSERMIIEDDSEDEMDQPTETIIQMKRDNGGGLGSMTRLVVPCTPEQLTELAELAINGERTFAINRLETNSRTLRRETLYTFRNWAVSNGFAIHPKPGSQEIVMNDDGLCLLEGWFENHALPDGYKFDGGGQDARELEPA
jgi:hypothetical protein